MMIRRVLVQDRSFGLSRYTQRLSRRKLYASVSRKRTFHGISPRTLIGRPTFSLFHDGRPKMVPLSSLRWTQSWSELSRREIAELEDRLCSAVAKRVQDPVLQQQLDSLQWLHRRVAISDDGTLQMLLRLPSLLHPSLEELKEQIRQEAETELQQWLIEKNRQEDWEAAKVNVEAIACKPVPMMARLVEDPEELVQSLGPGLANVSHFLAVYSCKGGVGKSTVAVNLAYELGRMGGRIGLIDLDVYGPSLPVLIRPEDTTIRRSPLGKGMVYPIEHHGVKALSLGFVSTSSGVPGSGPDNGATIMRGPFASKVVAQLIKGTDWGELDVLILDLPPGTGDVQLAVCQDLQMSGAVAVTTPSKLAAVDTAKGIEMFTSLGVPTLSVVQNMSYFKSDDGAIHYPFGRGLVKENAGGEPEVVQMPISVTTSDANDSGEPLCLVRPEKAIEELSAFQKLAKNVVRELLRAQYGHSDTESLVTFGTGEEAFDLATLSLALDKTQGNETFMVRLFADSGAIQKRLAPTELRSRDPKTGDMIPDSPFKDAPKDVPSSTDPMVSVHKASQKRSPAIIATNVIRKGRYGFAVEWGDGATIIYSMQSIAKAAGGVLTN